MEIHLESFCQGRLTSGWSAGAASCGMRRTAQPLAFDGIPREGLHTLEGSDAVVPAQNEFAGQSAEATQQQHQRAQCRVLPLYNVPYLHMQCC